MADTNELKTFDDVNLKTLAEDFTEVLSRHVGGVLHTSVRNFTITPIPMDAFGKELKIEFEVRDANSQQSIGRYMRR
jgi:hypothetical protein